MRRSPGPAVRVLLVEDNPRIAELRAEVFENLGCDVSTAGNAEDAIAALTSPTQFDVVMTDINLGDDPRDQSGLAIARWVRNSKSNLPIVGYSAVFAESELPMEEYPEITKWLVKASLRVADLKNAMEDVSSWVGRHGLPVKNDPSWPTYAVPLAAAVISVLGAVYVGWRQRDLTRTLSEFQADVAEKVFGGSYTLRSPLALKSSPIAPLRSVGQSPHSHNSTSRRCANASWRDGPNGSTAHAMSCSKPGPNS